MVLARDLQLTDTGSRQRKAGNTPKVIRGGPFVNRSLVEYREAVAVEMAVQGATYEAIAEVLQYRTRSGAWRAVRRALRKRTARAADAYWDSAMTDLELLQQRAWPAAMAGDVAASAVALRAIQQRCRLLDSRRADC